MEYENERENTRGWSVWERVGREDSLLVRMRSEKRKHKGCKGENQTCTRNSLMCEREEKRQDSAAERGIRVDSAGSEERNGSMLYEVQRAR